LAASINVIRRLSIEVLASIRKQQMSIEKIIKSLLGFRVLGFVEVIF